MLAVVRVRGTAGVKKGIADTMDMLKLTRINHAVLINENPSYNGMLLKSKDYITWGEVTIDTLTSMISKRGRVIGGDRVTDEYINENTDYASIKEFAEAIMNSETQFEDANIKPVFRLHPPRKGYEGIRNAFNEGGSLGFRDEAINDLILKML